MSTERIPHKFDKRLAVKDFSIREGRLLISKERNEGWIAASQSSACPENWIAMPPILKGNLSCAKWVSPEGR
jgi:hypothetical protein